MEPRRLPLHTVRKRRELSSQTPVIRLVVADGSLLFIVQIQHERHNTGDGAQSSKDSQQRRSYMYRLPRDYFPREPPTRLHSALAGWQATVFYRAPSD